MTETTILSIATIVAILLGPILAIQVSSTNIPEGIPDEIPGGSPGESPDPSPERPQASASASASRSGSGSASESASEVKPIVGQKTPDDMDDEPNAPPYAEIIGHLNAAAGKNFNPRADATRKYIRARWREGARLEQFIAAIDNQVRAWKGTGSFPIKITELPPLPPSDGEGKQI